METTKIGWITHNILLPYAFGFVTKQYKEMSKISYSGDIYKNTVAISVKPSEGDTTVSESTCECNFHSCMSLTCRHIFFFRKHKNMSSFDQCLVDHLLQEKPRNI